MLALKDGNKSDRIDARKLAELLRLDHLKPVYHGETGVRMLRELPDPRQRSDASHESVESGVSQLGDPLCGPGRLLHPSSSPVAGKDQGSRRPPAGRATLPATGHAATPPSASSARTVSGESKISSPTFRQLHEPESLVRSGIPAGVTSVYRSVAGSFPVFWN
jgi:hypothetical protein